MMDALFSPDYRRATWVCVFIAVANQMSGINILNIYAETIFEDVADAGGAAAFSPKACTYFIGVSGFVGAFLSNFTVKYLTRRQVFIVGHTCMGFCLLLVAICTVTNHGNLVLTFMCLFVISLQFSNGSAFWVYAAEVVCDPAMGICLFALWGFLVIQTIFANSLISLVGISGLFYILAGYQVFTIAVLFVFMKESQGLTGEQKRNLYKPGGGELKRVIA